MSQLAADRRMQLAATTSVPTSGRLTTMPSAASTVVRTRSAMGGGGRISGRATASSGGFSPPSWLIVLAAAVLLLGVVGWATLPGLLESDETTRLSELIDEAERDLATAGAAGQPDLRREALTRARGILLEATAMEGGAALAQPLLQQADREIADLDAIVPPADIRLLADLRGFGEAPIAARQLVVTDSHAYVLDSAGGQVISISLSTGKKLTVFAAGEETPLAPVAITHADVSRPAGSAALLIADEGGALWAWSPAGWVAEIPFARPAGMTMTDMYFTEGSLYVLDAPAAAILRFAATPSGFGLEPVVAHEAPDLSSARRLMVDGGTLLTAHEDGSIRRVSGGFALVLAQAGIDRPLAAAATPHTSGLSDEIAILDASADRIVILKQDGTFARQYRHEDLENVTAFTMQDGFGYVISGEQLRRITF